MIQRLRGGRSLIRDRGYVMALTALLILPLLAFTGFAVDLGAWNAEAARIQRAADAAALAGVVHLPNIGMARSVAEETARRNGYDLADADVTVTAQEVAGASSPQLEVTISQTNVNQYFSTLFKDQVDVERTATAEFIRSVPLGSPRNYLGTGESLSGAWRENLYVSVSGYCARREHGDRITPRADRTGAGFQSCDPSDSPVVENPEHNPDGYVFAMELAGAAEDYGTNSWGTVNLQLRNAPHCQGVSGGMNSHGDSGANTSSQRGYRYTVRDADSNNPLDASVLATQDLYPGNCNATWGGNNWQTIYSFTNPSPGTYYLQVQPIDPPSTTRAEGQNQFGIRAVNGGSPWYCTTDEADTALYVSGRACPQVYALTHLGVYAAFSGSNPSFFLSSVEPEHAGRTMTVELFDAAEGAEAIELLDPNGNPFPVEWEIGCSDGTYPSETGSACSPTEADPDGGRGPFNGTSIDVEGEGTQKWPELSQPGLYSNRHLRMKVELPEDYATEYGNRTWWRIRYTVCSGPGCSVGDRTTWTVRILGDPVRLVPNS